MAYGSEIIVPIATAALAGLFRLAQIAYRGWLYERHEKRKARQAALQGPASKPELAPSPPPDLGSLGMLLLILYGSMFAGIALQPLVARSPLEAINPKAKCTKANCPGRCVGGKCQAAAETPDPVAPKMPTTSAESLAARLVDSSDPSEQDPI